MKLIIDIDEHTYTFAKCYGFLSAEDEDTLDDVAKAIANGTPIPDNATNGEWVDVDERLPEEYGEYLVTWKTNDSSTPFISVCEYETSYEYDAEKHRFKGEWLVDDYILAHSDYEVIAWMPLPKPYQKGGEE